MVSPTTLPRNSVWRWCSRY